MSEREIGAATTAHSVFNNERENIRWHRLMFTSTDVTV